MRTLVTALAIGSTQVAGVGGTGAGVPADRNVRARDTDETAP